MVKIIFDVTNKGKVKILIKEGRGIIAATDLTVGKDFDNMLIKALDKLLADNKIERLSVKSTEISGKIEPMATSAMILKTVSNTLKL